MQNNYRVLLNQEKRQPVIIIDTDKRWQDVDDNIIEKGLTFQQAEIEANRIAKSMNGIIRKYL